MHLLCLSVSFSTQLTAGGLRDEAPQLSGSAGEALSYPMFTWCSVSKFVPDIECPALKFSRMQVSFHEIVPWLVASGHHTGALNPKSSLAD